ncbi:uncharacterized protein TNCV_1869261 [Trichonephila clavipes]|nr:uncharacterized protein TNCV_1869261 [Trichonephila clavipes]
MDLVNLIHGQVMKTKPEGSLSSPNFHTSSPPNGKTLSEGRFDLGTFRSERTNEASTLTITPRRSSSRDVGTSSYRYHTATYPLSVFRRIGERTIPYLWRACKQLRHFVGCVIVRDGLRIVSFVLDGFEK